MQTEYEEGICVCVSVCGKWKSVRSLSVCLCICLVKVSVLSVYSVCEIISRTKVCALCARRIVCVLRQPAERGEWVGGEHLHTVAQAFCLYTRLLPSSASRPSRLWPPRGSRGALPLKSQLCLVLSARQIFISPAVHLRSRERSPFHFLPFIFFGELLCRFKRA